MNIRLETPKDYREVENLTREAFWNVYRPGCTEHYVLNQYRANPDFIPELDLVMEMDDKIIGLTARPAVKRTVLYLLFALMLVNCSQQRQSQAGEAKILFEIRPEVNYVTHLYTLAGLGFSDEEYTTEYGNTLSKAAVDTLQKYKDYLTFGQGEGGDCCPYYR